MNVISELDTLCIVARQVYGDRGVVLASSDDPRWFVAVEEPKLALEVAEIMRCSCGRLHLGECSCSHAN